MMGISLLHRRVVLRPWPLAPRIDGRAIPPGSGVSQQTFDDREEARQWARETAEAHDCPVVDRT